MKKVILILLVILIKSQSIADEWLLIPESDIFNEDIRIYQIQSDSTGNVYILFSSNDKRYISFMKSNKWYSTMIPDSSKPISPHMAIDGNGIVWITTFKNGLYKFDQGEVTRVFESDSSSNEYWNLENIAVDSKNHLLIPSSSGIYYYDGEKTVFYKSTDYNIDIGDFKGAINYISMSRTDELWLGYYPGISKFTLDDWIIYTPENSDVPYEDNEQLVFDNYNNLWFQSMQGFASLPKMCLMKFDGENFINYNDSIGIKSFGAMDYDRYSNDLWFLAELKDERIFLRKYNLKAREITDYDTLNSSLPNLKIYMTHCDINGNKWFAIMDFGLAVYNENGVYIDVDELKGPADHLIKLYPNPATDYVRIENTRGENICIYDVLGRACPVRKISENAEGVTLDTGALEPGTYFITVQGKEGVQAVPLVVVR